MARGDWGRRYPPLAGGLLALVLAAVVLPSALDVPQTNPTTTPEIAPIPESDEDAPTPQGAIASLGIAGGAGAGTTTTTAPPPPIDGSGRSPRGKRCVGDPPRQSDDRLSPPCVAYFKGDNGGSTYQGVDAGEIRIVAVGDANLGRRTDRGAENEDPLKGQCIDVASPAGEQTDSVTVRNLRRFLFHFNDRYQTYERRVRIFVCFSTSAKDATGTYDEGKTPETRRADAANDYERVRPFAVLTSQMEAGFEQPYVEAMNECGVLSFGSKSGSRRRRSTSVDPGSSGATCRAWRSRPRSCSPTCARRSSTTRWSMPVPT